MAGKAPDYNDLMRTIAPFVNFKHDRRRDLNKTLTGPQKARITRNYKILRPLLARNNHVYRPRGRGAAKRLKSAQNFGRHSKNSKNINVALIPVSGKNNRVTIKNDVVTVRSKFVTTRTFSFDQAELARDAHAHALDVMQRSGADNFVIQAGEFEIQGTRKARATANRVLSLTERYSPGGERYKESREGKPLNHYNQWLHGVTAVEFDNQSDLDDFSRARFTKKNKRKCVRCKRTFAQQKKERNCKRCKKKK